MRSIVKTNIFGSDRQKEDFYSTPPYVVEKLCKLEQFDNNIWECACGEGHISKVLEDHGYKVRNTDIIDRMGNDILDFLSIDNVEPWNGDIVTNPPYRYAQEFIEKALQIVTEGHKVAMFLKLTFLEGKQRRALFAATPPLCVYISSSRILCGKNGKFEGNPSAVAFAWFIWQKGFKGDPIIKWFN